MNIFPSSLEKRYTFIIVAFLLGVASSIAAVLGDAEVSINLTGIEINNWLLGIGSLLLGLGTVGIAFAGLKTIPDKIGEQHKDKELVALYQKAIFRMYRKVEASSEGITFSMPNDLEQLTKLLLNNYPQIGTKEDADRIIDDLMLDNYFQTVVGNATVIKTAKWDPKDRTKKVAPLVSNLPGD